MTNETQNKFAAILAAAQQKAANKTIPNFTPLQAQKEPEIIPIPEPEPLPEMSNMTFADLMPEAIPEPEPEQKSKLQYVDYSDKAFAIIGETKPIKDQLRSLGGSFNAHLKCGAGWIFSKTRLATVKSYLAI